MGRGRIVVAVAAMALLGSVVAACGGDKQAGAAGTTADPLAVPTGIDPSAPAGDAGTPAAAVKRVDAAVVIRRLWTTRQTIMLTEDADGFRTVDTGTLLTHDLSVAALVACRCEKPRDQSPLQAVRVLRPREASPRTIIAEVQTEPPGEAPTDFVVVARRAGKKWRMAFVAILASGSTGRIVDDTAKRPPATTAGDRRAGSALFDRYAREVQRWSETGRPISSDWAPTPATRKKLLPGPAGANHGRTSYGAEVVATVETPKRPAPDVFRLDRKRVVSCGAVRETSTATVPQGALQQDAGRRSWGPWLAPGVYRSITSTGQDLFCILDHGPAARPRYEIIGDYFSNIVAVKGTK